MFDGLPKIIPLDRPSAKGMVYILRHPETWPPNFRWDYSYCSHCAIGLGHAFWGTYDRERLAAAIGLNEATSMNIFVDLNRVLGFEDQGKMAITPEHVADAIERVFAWT
jgi:hypothetical protein